MKEWSRDGATTLGCVESLLGRVGLEGGTHQRIDQRGISSANQGLLALHQREKAREKRLGAKKIEVVPKAS